MDIIHESPSIAFSVIGLYGGYSTHRLDDFVGLLRAYGIERLVDVRTIPRSRHNPQFNHDTLGEFP